MRRDCDVGRYISVTTVKTCLCFFFSVVVEYDCYLEYVSLLHVLNFSTFADHGPEMHFVMHE